MAASFRNTSQIIELAGCDKLTISPALLEELSSTNGEITQKLKSEDSSSLEIERIKINESAFRWHLNENQMASFKLAEGIRLFNKDLSKLRDLIFNQI
jgi:transaldolase